MCKLLLLILLLIPCAARAQTTIIFVNCTGGNDTPAFTSIINAAAGNNVTIHPPFKSNSAQRCKVNTLTIPANVTIDNTDGSGISVATGQTLTVLGPVIAPAGKATFFGPGSTIFTGNTFIGTNGQALVSDGAGGTTFATISGGGGGGGAVDSFEGRTGPVVSAFGDYTWAEIDKSTSSLADLSTRSANELSNGVTGTGLVVLHDSPSVLNLTASKVNNVTITNPGTAATLTLANTKTFAVNNTMTLAGTLDGQSILFPASGTVAMSADTLSVSSVNATGAAHTHAITTSANPGAAASILATNSSGYLQLLRLGIGVAPTQSLEVAGNVFVNAATANLFLKDTSTGWQSATSTVITPQANNFVRSVPFTSGVDGWNIAANGDAEFNNVRIRGELAASVFKVSEITATAGTFGVFKSAATLTTDTISPGIGSSDTFDARNSDLGGALFAVGDRLRFKGFTGSGIADIWYTVTAVTNNGSTTTYTATHEAGSTGVTLQAGMAIIDYGPAGTGFITLSTDGTVGSSPNMTMATHSGSPWSSFTTLSRSGNLNGSYGYATDIYGSGFGQYGVAGQSWLTVDSTNGVRIGNGVSVLTQVDAAGNASFTGAVTATSGSFTGTIHAGLGDIAGWSIGTNALSSGTTYLASNLDIPLGPVAWFGKSATGYQGLSLRDASNRQIGMITGDGSIFPYFTVYDGSHQRVIIGGLNNAWCNDGATASMGMKVCDASGNLLVQFHDLDNTIANWKIATNRISAGTGPTTVGMDATVTGGDDVRFFAGSSTLSSAPFRVTEAGALIATNANITGAITATSGTFAGSLSAATGTFAGDLSGAGMSLTGKLSLSGASSAIAIGTTPPTSCTAGNGIFIDRNAICSVLSNTTSAKIDALGFTAILNGTNVNSIYFAHATSGENVMQLQADRNGTATGSRGQLFSQGNAANANSTMQMWTREFNGATDAHIDTYSTPSTAYATIYGTGLTGLKVGANSAPATTGSGASLHVTGNTIRIENSRTPASASATCNAGEIAWDSSFIYVCVSANTWKRSAISTW